MNTMPHFEKKIKSVSNVVPDDALTTPSFRFRLTAPKTRHFVADRISYRTPPQSDLTLEYSIYGIETSKKYPD